jgi:hypothetical protein
MDDHRFDALTKTLTNGGSRRGALQSLGASALAAVVARLGLEDDAEAKKKRKNKKKKKCKGATKKCNGKCIPVANCCVDGDCDPGQLCQNGTCLLQEVACQNDGDCGVNEVCQNGTCVPDPGQFCQGNGDCDSGEACFAGTCVPIAGTCDATDDHCSVVEALCNPDGVTDCFCLQRFGGGVACTEDFVLGSQCGNCTSDADCDALEAGSVCVSAVAFGCPCDPGEGICARLCPNQ